MNDHEKLEYDVEILFYNGQRLTWRLENSNCVVLQLKVYNKHLYKKEGSFIFNENGLTVDIRCIMAITEKEVDYGD